MFKKLSGLFTAAVMCLTLCIGGAALTAGASAVQEEIFLNENRLEMKALDVGGTVYLPVRNICEKLGYTVQWVVSDGTKTVVTSMNDKTVTLDITNQTITHNNTTAPMAGNYSGDGCILENSRTYLESSLFSATYGVNIGYDEQSGKITVNRILDKNTVNILNIGNTACVILKGNPTTGYEWHMTIGDDSVIAKIDENYVSDSKSDKIIGAGGTYKWTFKALKKGETTITFKYYRSWMGEDSAAADDIITYKIIVD